MFSQVLKQNWQQYWSDRCQTSNSNASSVSSIGKVFCRQTRDLASNPVYTKNQLVYWLDNKSNYHGVDIIGSNYRNFKQNKKKDHVVEFEDLIGLCDIFLLENFAKSKIHNS